MKTQALKQIKKRRTGTILFQIASSGKLLNYFPILFFASFIFSTNCIYAQGTWTQVKQNSPDTYGGQMLLLTDGTVIIKSEAGGGDGVGNIWEKLTPDIHGSYINGTWTKTMAAMHNTRLDFSSQVLKDGRVYVAGGEYGTGNAYAETYDPLTNVWTMAPSTGQKFVDANSEILENGKVLQAVVMGTDYLRSILIYDPVKNTFTTGPSSAGAHNESTWIKLPDNSILQVDRNAKTSERYIPEQNKWVADGNVPVSLYDPYGLETGAGFLLPDGRVVHFGSLGANAIYTPSGNTSPGTWKAIASFPNGLGTPDAPAAMMVNGKILCMANLIPTSANHFPPPSTFFEYNYLTDAFTPIKAPTGGATLDISTWMANMLALPDGSILYAQQNSSKYYVYTPDGSPLSAGKPTINKIYITNNTGNCTYKITGTTFNGISEGAAYGDDEQMATNYPIIRLTSGTNAYYARTFNWNSTGVMRGNKPDTAEFTIPAGISLTTTYSLVVTANGIASNPVLFTPCVGIVSGIEETTDSNRDILVYPNPASEQTALTFKTQEDGAYTIKVIDIMGRTIQEETGKAISGDNTHLINVSNIGTGTYMIFLQKGTAIYKTKFLIH
jgi:hypothetical protein